MEINVLKSAVISILGITQVNSLPVKDSFNILMKDSAVYSIDELLNSNDYEMIRISDQIYKKNDIKDMLHDLNNLAKETYEKKFKTAYTDELSSEDMVLRENIEYEITPLFQLPKHFIHKRNADQQELYDYDDLISEYVELDDKDIITNEEKKSPIGLTGIICLVDELITKGESPKIILARLWRLFRIWLFVYFAVAVPLWCTKGWCCCCLCCKCLKPHRMIDDAKKYFLLNPPGLLTMPNVGVICYEATEREKECYEKLGHTIRTI